MATSGHSHESAILRALVEDRADREWCLFLDRDGVINRRVVGDYVRNWRQFEWLPGAPSAVRILRRWAPHIVVVTNQQGIGKGLMSNHDLEAIHRRIQNEVASGGRPLDAFQVCPHLAADRCECRKPRPGLVLDWLGKNTQCDPRLSIVVGDSLSDLELARNVASTVGGCAAVHITVGADAHNAEIASTSLWDFAGGVAAVRGDEFV